MGSPKPRATELSAARGCAGGGKALALLPTMAGLWLRRLALAACALLPSGAAVGGDAYVPIPAGGPSDLRDLGINLTGVYAQQYDIMSELTRKIRQSPAVLRAARPFVFEGTTTLAYAWPSMRVCVSKKGQVQLSAPADGADPADDAVRTRYAALWLLSERAGSNYGHFTNSLINLFAAVRDAGLVREPRARGAPWAVHPELSVVLNPQGSAGLSARFEAVARAYLPAVVRLARPAGRAHKSTMRCTRLPETVYGAGAAGMGNIWDYFSDAGTRMLGGHGRRPRDTQRGSRRWRAREVVSAFQRYTRTLYAIPHARAPDAPLPDGRVRRLVVIEQRGADRSQSRAKRSIRNLDELLSLGKELGAGTRAFRLEVRAVEFAALPLKEAATLLDGAHALVGVEGSGLTNVLFLRPGSALINVKPFPQCDSDGYDPRTTKHFLADSADGIVTPHAANQMFGLYGSFEKLALACEQPIHLLPLCAPAADVEYNWENTKATARAVAKGEVDAHGLPLLGAASYGSPMKLMRQMWYINSVMSVRVDPALFRSALHALHHLWIADRFAWPGEGREGRAWRDESD